MQRGLRPQSAGSPCILQRVVTDRPQPSKFGSRSLPDPRCSLRLVVSLCSHTLVRAFGPCTRPALCVRRRLPSSAARRAARTPNRLAVPRVANARHTVPRLRAVAVLVALEFSGPKWGEASAAHRFQPAWRQRSAEVFGDHSVPESLSGLGARHGNTPALPPSRSSRASVWCPLCGAHGGELLPARPANRSRTARASCHGQRAARS